MPPPRIRRVILRVSEPSAPDTPAAPPPPSPEPQMPPTQPPNPLPLDTGLQVPIPNDSQQTPAQNTPPHYAPPYGTTFYPPAPAYPQHQLPFPPYGAINGVPQLWGYAQYHSPPQPPQPYFEARGRVTDWHVDQDPSQREDMTVGGKGANVAAQSSSEVARTKKYYPNKEVSPGGKCLTSHTFTTCADCLKFGNSR